MRKSLQLRRQQRRSLLRKLRRRRFANGSESKSTWNESWRQQHWSSKWFAKKSDFAEFLVEDNQIRTFVKKKLYNAGVSSIVIERPAAEKVKVIVMCARPGMVIGRSGEGIEEFKKGLVKLTGRTVDVSIEEVRKTELDAQLTAEAVAAVTREKNFSEEAMKQPIGPHNEGRRQGHQDCMLGQIGGAEIARSEKRSEGMYHCTLRADIDYGFAEADTTYETSVVKCMDQPR